jgi:hypothetical protein
MNNGQIYDFVNIILRKEKEGSVVSPERFTLLLIESMWEKLNYEFSGFEKSQIITDTLRGLKVTEDINLNGSGLFDLTSLAEEYFHPTSLYYTYNGSVREIRVVTDAEWAYYTSNSLLAPSDEFPIVKISGDNLEFSPIISVTVTLTYLKNPTEPFFDYYFDADDKIVYLTEGQNYTLQTGEEYRDGTLPPNVVSSISVELPFPQSERIDIAYKILQKFGISLQDAMAAEFGNKKEIKEEAL